MKRERTDGSTAIGRGALDAGCESPDVVAVLTPEGGARVGGQLRRLTATGRVFSAPGLGEIETRAPVTVHGARLPGAARGYEALAFLAAMTQSLSLLPPEALLEAASGEPEERRQALREAVACGLDAAPHRD